VGRRVPGAGPRRVPVQVATMPARRHHWPCSPPVDPCTQTRAVHADRHGRRSGHMPQESSERLHRAVSSRRRHQQGRSSASG
jgi:hypothetical protein